MSSRSIEQLLKEGRHYDNDIKIMALNDLCAKMIEENKTLDSQVQNEICEIFLLHLDATSIDVQSNSIRCIGNCVSKIQEVHLVNLLNKLSKHLLQDDHQAKQIRDIYATCIKTIISKVPDNFAEIVCGSILKNCFAGLKGQIDQNLEEELIEIINNVLKKFSMFLYTFNSPFLKSEYPTYLLSKIVIPQDTLRKKICASLGLLSQILTNAQVQGIANNLMENIKKNSDKKTILYFVQALNSVSKYVASKLSSVLKTLIPFVIQQCESFKNINENEDLDLANELLENYLSIIDQFIKGCHKDIQPFLREILEIATLFIKYDPNNIVNIDGEAMEIENDEDDYYDDYQFTSDDSSWRVRRASIHIIDTLLKNKKDMVKEISDFCILDLVKRLREKDENVRGDTFTALNNYFKAIVYGDISNVTTILEESLSLIRMKSTATESVNTIIDQLLEELIKIFQGNNSLPIKIKASNLLFTASLCVPNVFLLKKNWVDIFGTFKSVLLDNKDTSKNEIRLNLMLCLRRLFRFQHENSAIFFEYLDDFANICHFSIQNSYFKIAAEGFRLLSAFFKVLRPSHQSPATYYGKFVKPFLPLVNAKLKEADIDQEIKQSVIQNVAMIINIFGDQLTSQELKEILELLFTKLKNEVTRLPALKALHKFPRPNELTLAIDPNIVAVIRQIMQELCVFLLKQSRTLKISTLESLIIFVEVLKEKIDESLHREIVKNLANFIKDEDFYLAQISLQLFSLLIAGNVKNLQECQAALENCIKLAKSPLVQGALLTRLLEIFENFAKFNLIDVISTVDRLNQGDNKNALNTIAKCISVMVLATPQAKTRANFIETCVKYILLKSDNSEDLMKQQTSLLIIREIGKTVDFSSNELLVNGVLECLNSKHEGIKNSGSLALGGICLGNQANFLPKVMSLIKSPDHREYLILNTLKEIIQDSKDISKSLIDLVPFLFDYAENKDESLKNFVAECVGKICLLKFDEVQQILEKNLNSPKISRKYTAISAFKHFSTRTFPSEKLQTLVNRLFSLIGDADITIRKAILSSLTTIAYNLPRLFKDADTKFYEFVRENLKIVSSLIKEVELGPFKHKVDEGLPLRACAYSFVETSVESLLPVHHIDAGLYNDAILGGLDESNDDILIICLHIIQKLCLVNPYMILSIIDSITDKIRVRLEKLAKSAVGKQEGDRNSDLFRAVVRCCLAISKVADIETSPKFCDFFNEVQKNALVQEILKSLQAN